MSLSPEAVQKVARLSRLKLTAQEQSQFATQLGQILDYVNLLSEAPTQDVEPLAHIAELTNVFRSDEPQPSLSRADALRNAPKADGKYFQVPAILEGA